MASVEMEYFAASAGTKSPVDVHFTRPSKTLKSISLSPAATAVWGSKILGSCVIPRTTLPPYFEPDTDAEVPAVLAEHEHIIPIHSVIVIRRAIFLIIFVLPGWKEDELICFFIFACSLRLCGYE